MIKLGGMSAALAAALELDERTAKLVAELSITLLRVAFERWLEEGERELAEHVRDALGQLSLLSGP